MKRTKHNRLRLLLAFFSKKRFLINSKRKMSAQQVAFENAQARPQRANILEMVAKKPQVGSIIIGQSLYEISGPCFGSDFSDFFELLWTFCSKSAKSFTIHILDIILVPIFFEAHQHTFQEMNYSPLLRFAPLPCTVYLVYQMF